MVLCFLSMVAVKTWLKCSAKVFVLISAMGVDALMAPAGEAVGVKANDSPLESTAKNGSRVT